MGVFERRISRLTRPQKIKSSFPMSALVTFDTIVGMQLNPAFDTLSDGYKTIGAMNLTSLEDLLYTTPAVEAGLIRTATVNATGADDMARIYKQYRVHTSQIIIRWRNNTPQATIVGKTDQDLGFGAGSETIDFTGTTESIPAHRLTHFAQQHITLAIIPTPEPLNPAATWSEVMHHPLAVFSKQRIGSIHNSWNTLKVPEINTSHFNRATIQLASNVDLDAVLDHRKNFDDNSGSGLDGAEVYLYFYMLDATGLSDTADIEIEGTYYIRQKCQLWKTDENGDSALDVIGQEGAHDFGDLQPLPL